MKDLRISFVVCTFNSSLAAGKVTSFVSLFVQFAHSGLRNVQDSSFSLAAFPSCMLVSPRHTERLNLSFINLSRRFVPCNSSCVGRVVKNERRPFCLRYRNTYYVQQHIQHEASAVGVKPHVSIYS